MTLFLSVGYAAITGHLRVEGEGYYNDPATIFIRSISVKSSNANVTGTPSVSKAGFVVFQHGDYTLNKQKDAKNPGGSITIEILVENNSDVGQYFLSHSTNTTLAKTTVVTLSGIKAGDLLASGETRSFTITIQNTHSRNNVSLKDVISTLNFSPDFDESFTEGATESIATIFANVLANLGIDGEGQGIVYKGKDIPANQILKQITDSMENVDTGGYMGNVGNATQDQKDLIAAIFGDNITMQIGNQYYSVYLLIKNQQIDGKGANDMVLYVTADQLAVGGGNWSNNAWRNLNVVPVYGLVFINEGNNKYTYCDHMFVGEAPVCNMGGEFGADRVGNFNTNLWNSTEYADLTDTSGGQITQQYITTNGELDEAYQRYIKEQKP